MDYASQLRNWAQLLKKIRAFFDEKSFFEVTTNHFVSAGAFEACIDGVSARDSRGEGQLHSSPEIEMKALLANSPLPIYQICRCFRDDPPTGVHWREFTMLEFYEPGAMYETMIGRVKEILETFSPQPVQFVELDFYQTYSEKFDLDLSELTTVENLAEKVREKDLVHVGRSDNWDDIVNKILIEKIEPELDPEVVTILRDYPPSQAALAKVNPSKDRAERFEFYWKGFELCNGCTELTDLPELKRRWQKEQTLRQENGKSAHPKPTRLFEAFEIGLPECAGVAVGLERLALALGKIKAERRSESR